MNVENEKRLAVTERIAERLREVFGREVVLACGNMEGGALTIITAEDIESAAQRAGQELPREESGVTIRYTNIRDLEP